MMNDGREWKPSVIFPDDYLVSSDGRVYSIRSKKNIAPAKDKDGHLYYVLCVDGERRTIKAHRLVAMTFLPNPCGKKTVDHINTIKTDNRVENLRWASLEDQWANEISYARHKAAAVEVGKRNIGKPSTQRVPVMVFKGEAVVGRYNSMAEAAESLGLNTAKVCECANGKRKSTKGYTIRKESA